MRGLADDGEKAAVVEVHDRMHFEHTDSPLEDLHEDNALSGGGCILSTVLPPIQIGCSLGRSPQWIRCVVHLLVVELQEHPLEKLNLVE